jgi:hypothetical protein
MRGEMVGTCSTHRITRNITFWLENLKGGQDLGNRGKDGRIILKWIEKM